MKVSCCFLEELNIINWFHCMSSPRYCHDGEEKAIWTIGRKFVPTDVTNNISWEWLYLHIPWLWLDFSPPLNPLRSIAAHIGDYRHLLQGVLLSLSGLKFLRLRLSREVLKLLDSVISLILKTVITSFTYSFYLGKLWKSKIPFNHHNPAYSTENSLPVDDNSFIDETLMDAIEVKGVVLCSCQ